MECDAVSRVIGGNTSKAGPPWPWASSWGSQGAGAWVAGVGDGTECVLCSLSGCSRQVKNHSVN